MLKSSEKRVKFYVYKFFFVFLSFSNNKYSIDVDTFNNLNKINKNILICFNNNFFKA